MATAEPKWWPVRLFSYGWLLTQIIHILSWLDLSPLNKLIDLRLDHWHLSRRHGSFFTSFAALLRALTWQGSVGQGVDNAAYEVQPSASRRLNEGFVTHPETMYLSFAAQRAPMRGLVRTLKHETTLSHRLGAVVREAVVYFFSCMLRLGGESQRATACEREGYDPDEWKAHDGLLSVRGQRAPLGEPTQPLPERFKPAELDGRRSSKAAEPKAAVVDDDADDADDAVLPRTPSTREMICSSAVAVQQAQMAKQQQQQGGVLAPGVWHTMELDMDHFSVCGGPLASHRCLEAFWSMYLRVREDCF